MSHFIPTGDHTSALVPDTHEEREACRAHIDYLNAIGQSDRVKEFSNITGVHAAAPPTEISDRNQILLECHTANTLG